MLSAVATDTFCWQPVYSYWGEDTITYIVSVPFSTIRTNCVKMHVYIWCWKVL